jgi:hypothetical protein
MRPLILTGRAEFLNLNPKLNPYPPLAARPLILTGRAEAGCDHCEPGRKTF